jgi:hypothetical protein
VFDNIDQPDRSHVVVGQDNDNVSSVQGYPEARADSGEPTTVTDHCSGQGMATVALRLTSVQPHVA